MKKKELNTQTLIVGISLGIGVAVFIIVFLLKILGT